MQLLLALNTETNRKQSGSSGLETWMAAQLSFIRTLGKWIWKGSILKSAFRLHLTSMPPKDLHALSLCVNSASYNINTGRNYCSNVYQNCLGPKFSSSSYSGNHRVWTAWEEVSTRWEMPQDSPLEILLVFKLIFAALLDLYCEKPFFIQLKVMVRLVKYGNALK